MGRKIRVGIVGTGGMGHAHAKHYSEIKEAELVSCLDVVPEKSKAFAAKWGIPKPAEHLEELIDKVDAVSVVTPDRHHFEPALKTLQSGKHLLTEKPLTVTLDHARKLHHAARKASRKGVVHMINFSYRNASAVSAAAQLVRKGSLGNLRHVNSSYFQTWLSQPVWGHWTQEWALWRLQKAAGSGGVLADIGCHILDLTTEVAGDVARLRCNLACFPKVLENKEITAYKGKKLDANDTALIELEFSTGATGVVQATRWGTGYQNLLRCEVHGTKGAVRLDLDKGYHQMEVCLGKDAGKAKWVQKKLKPVPNNHERFIQAILTGRQAQPDVPRGAKVQAYLEACLKSSQSGRWEKVPS